MSHSYIADAIAKVDLKKITTVQLVHLIRDAAPNPNRRLSLLDALTVAKALQAAVGEPVK